MGAPSIPNDFDFTHHLLPEKDFELNTHMDGGLNTNMSGAFGVAHSGALNTNLSGNLNTNNVLKLTGDPAAPVATDSKIEILNLPRFTLQDIKDMTKIRVRIPNYSNLCFKILGMEMFSLCMSGEGQVITEPYIPNAGERCEVNCCEPDTRPFPGSVKGTENPDTDSKDTGTKK